MLSKKNNCLDAIKNLLKSGALKQEEYDFFEKILNASPDEIKNIDHFEFLVELQEKNSDGNFVFRRIAYCNIFNKNSKEMNKVLTNFTQYLNNPMYAISYEVVQQCHKDYLTVDGKYIGLDAPEEDQLLLTDLVVSRITAILSSIVLCFLEKKKNIFQI